MTLILPQAISPALGNSLFAASIYGNVLGGNLIWVIMLALSKSLAPPPRNRADIPSAAAGWVHSLTLQGPTGDWRENINRDDDLYE